MSNLSVFLLLLFWPLVLSTTGKPFFFSLCHKICIILEDCVPTCFSYLEQSQFSHSVSELHFLKHFSLISLLWTLPICFLSFLNCSTQIYKQPRSAAKSSYQLLSHWISCIWSPGTDISVFWSKDQLLLLPNKAYWRGKPFFHGLLTSGNMLAFFTDDHCHQSPGTRWTKKRHKLLIPARNLNPLNIRKKPGKVHQFSTSSQKL